MPQARLGRAGAATLAALLAACGGGDSPSGPSPTPTPTPPTGGGVFEYDGVTHVSWWHDEYGYPAGGDSRRALAATGAGWMGLLTTWYMETRSSNRIAPDVGGNSNDDDVVRRAIDEAHSLGLKVMLKPHVDVRDGTWRAQIAPADPGAWFESYGAFVDHYAGIAAEKNVEMLVIGTELISMTRSGYAGQWASLAARVRSRYRGALTYAANANDAGDEFTSASVWPHVDVLGLDVYTPLTSKTNPTRAELAAAWRRNRDGNDMLGAYRNFQSAWGKPLIFTEIGYRSLDGANRAPWDWGVSGGTDAAEQADCYAAMYEVWSKEAAWFRGPFWWAWDVAAPGAGDSGYNPRGKPAEELLRQWQR